MNSPYISGTIYCITNAVNGMQYVGQTRRQLSARWRAHLNDSGKRNYYLYNAMQKYGVENFTVMPIVIGIHTIEELNRLEVEYIAKYGTFTNGYNLTTGGEGGYIKSERTLDKIRGANNTRFGKPLSAETKALLAAKATGRKHSDETKAKLSQRMIGNTISDPEIFRKLQELRKDKTEYTFVHPIHGEVTASASDFAKMHEPSCSAAHSLIKARYKSSCGWRLKNSTSKQTRLKVYKLYNVIVGKEAVGTRLSLAKICDLSPNAVGKLIRGITKLTHNSWEFRGEMKV